MGEGERVRPVQARRQLGRQHLAQQRLDLLGGHDPVERLPPIEIRSEACAHCCGTTVDQNIANGRIPPGEECLQEFTSDSDQRACKRNHNRVPESLRHCIPQQKRQHEKHGYVDALLGPEGEEVVKPGLP